MATKENIEEIISTSVSDLLKEIKNKEAVQNDFENDISKNEVVNFDNIETFDEVLDDKSASQKNVSNEWEYIEPVSNIEDNSNCCSNPIIDLSGDIYVNDILANSEVPINSDVEVFDTIGQHIISKSSVVPDLNQDIYVNDILVNSGALINSDAKAFETIEAHQNHLECCFTKK